ncbi:MAG: hypothetical protein ABH830_05045 [Patescibacteria group bacterium]
MIKTKKENNVEIKEDKKSSVSEFIRRPLPTEDEVEKFEDIIEEEARADDIKESLTEIYQDDNGDVVNVKKLDIKRKRGFIFWFFSFITLSVILGSLGYGVYYFLFAGGSDATAFQFSISGEEKVVAGEEFFYEIEYRNLSNVKINNARIEVNYPEDFIILDSSPLPDEKNSVWLINSIEAKARGSIKIKGKIINKEETESIILARITYTPDNFSSEFKKEASFTALVKATGIDFSFDNPSSVLIGDENEIIIGVRSQEENYITDFIIEIEPLENMEIIKVEAGEKSKITIEKLKPTSYRISGLGEEKEETIITYIFLEKLVDSQEIIIRINKDEEENKVYNFEEKKISQEIMKSDLNLTLIINGTKNDQATEFGETLNYSIVYTNKGETTMTDVMIMAVLESDFLDWTSLADDNKGREKGNTITWSKEEISSLAELNKNDEGVIDFSLKVSSFDESDLGKNFQIKSYAQYSLGNEEEFKENIDNRSNTIINKINSDIKLNEEVRYFSADNIPVGNGPLPPKVGEATSFKVYWTLNNNLHELTNTRVKVKLPNYVSWDNKNRTSVGSLNYDSNNHEVVWQIGRLPITVYRADAEFNISITPVDSDKNKIMVLLPGSEVQAIDNETGATIVKNTKAKTTKLEDDEIAGMNSDGRVE